MAQVADVPVPASRPVFLADRRDGRPVTGKAVRRVGAAAVAGTDVLPGALLGTGTVPTVTLRLAD